MSTCPTSKVINFSEKLDLISEHWQPKVIAQMNDYQFKIVKILGDFVMHTHANTDETFIVLEGELRIDMENKSIYLNVGEMYIVPANVAHKPYAENEVKLLLIEPCGITNTGDQCGERTAPNDVWI
ncbi:MAG: cupin domain-containing protein [Acinetobacter sp.]